MNLQLDPEQAELLREILDGTYRELRYEVADTDNSRYRAKLRTKEQALRELLDLVGGPLDDR